MEFPDVLSVQVSSAHSGAGCVGWNEVSPLAIEAYNHQNGVVAMHIWKLHNEVNRGHTPLFHGCGQRVQLTGEETVLRLGSEAEVTGAGVGAYVS